MSRVAPIFPAGQGNTVLRHGEVFRVENRCLIGSALRRVYAVLRADLTLGLWDPEEIHSQEGGSFRPRDGCRERQLYSLGGVTLEWGVLGTNELALRLNLADKRNRQQHTTLVLRGRHARQSLRSWVLAFQLLFANSDHAPCRAGSVGGDECSICLSDFEHNELVAILHCKHRFHETCIQDWLKVNPTCPHCRVNAVDSEDGTPLLSTGRFQR